MHNPVVNTERLELRPLQEGDEELLMEIFFDPIAMTFYESTKDLTEAKAYVAKAQRLYRERKMGFFACFLKGGGSFVGICGLLVQNVDGIEEIEVGYLFVRKHWGHGYATEAAKGCMEYAFHTLGVKRVISLILPENTPSIRVAERNGLTQEKMTTFKGRRAYVYVKFV